MVKLNYAHMKRRCLAGINDFRKLGVTVDDGQGEFHTFIDNGGSVLAVAHLDTVVSTDHFHVVKIKGEDLILNAQLDDRLGAYIILDLLPKYVSRPYDILLTTGEETGNSTAKGFDLRDYGLEGKQYNWMFSFDRAGDDVVMYQYDEPHYKDMLKAAGFTHAHGSFSDIADLDHLNCTGFNFGCGYENNHSAYAYAHTDQTRAQVDLFIPFYHANYDTHLTYVPKPKKTYSVRSGEGTWYNWRDYDDPDKDFDYRAHNAAAMAKYGLYKCEECNTFAKIDQTFGMCDACKKKYNMDFCLYCGSYTGVANSLCAECSERLDPA